jgi:hypothetical protein
VRTDSDGDGLFDHETVIYGTKPQVFDTDGDGAGDGEEIYLGTNPAPSRNIPQGVPAPRNQERRDRALAVPPGPRR